MQTQLTENEEQPRGRGIYLLPNLFTLTALFAGFYAIVSAMKGNFDHAAISIFIAMIMDTLDGRVARLTNTQTAFGAELDSLSDMVCFGLAPALIAYSWGLNTLGKAGWLLSFLYTASVALRLARFNTEIGTADKRFFKGLPCTAGAPVIISLIWSADQYGLNGSLLYLIAAILTPLVGAAMVSRIPYYSFKDFNIRNKVPFVVMLLIALSFVLISVDPPLILLGISFAYFISGPLFVVWRWKSKRKLKLRLK